jgi:hypothetical protein
VFLKRWLGTFEGEAIKTLLVMDLMIYPSLGS